MKPYYRHLQSAEGLITLPQDTRAGFVALALERNRRATPYVAEGRALRVEASKVSEPVLLKQVDQIQAALLTCGGRVGQGCWVFPGNGQGRSHR